MVSIIITFIDEYDFLAEAVKSAMDQTSDELELIVVCNLPDLPQEYQPITDLKSNFSFIHEPKQGSAYARNAGLQKASGEWVQFLDVDDLIMPEKIQHQLVRSADTAIVSPHIFKYVDGTLQDSKWLPEDTWIGILNSGLGSTSSMLWHRETLLSIGGWSANYHSHQEYELLFRLAAQGYEITKVDLHETIVRQRISGSITLNTQSIRIREGIQLREKIWEFLKQKDMATTDRKNAFLQYVFRQLRGLYRQDRQEALSVFQKLYALEKFVPENNGIPFYNILYRSFGFRTTESIFAIYSHVRKKYLPILPVNH